MSKFYSILVLILSVFTYNCAGINTNTTTTDVRAISVISVVPSVPTTSGTTTNTTTTIAMAVGMKVVVSYYERIDCKEASCKWFYAPIRVLTNGKWKLYMGTFFENGRNKTTTTDVLSWYKSSGIKLPMVMITCFPEIMSTGGLLGNTKQYHISTGRYQGRGLQGMKHIGTSNGAHMYKVGNIKSLL